MSEPANQTNELLHIYQDWFRAPQNFLPSQHFTETVTAAARGFVEAQTAYLQAMMSMNAKILEAVFDKSEAAADQHLVPAKVKAARVTS